MGFVRREVMAGVAEAWARKKACFPNSKRTARRTHDFIYDEIGIPRDIPLTPRNYEVTTIAPTGTISLVAETSSGIEPNFSWAYVRQDTLGHADLCSHRSRPKLLGIDVDQTDEESIKAAAEYVVEHESELPAAFYLGNEDQIARAREGTRGRSKACR